MVYKYVQKPSYNSTLKSAFMFLQTVYLIAYSQIESILYTWYHVNKLEKLKKKMDSLKTRTINKFYSTNV